jgi:hypothetical protein
MTFTCSNRHTLRIVSTLLVTGTFLWTGCEVSRTDSGSYIATPSFGGSKAAPQINAQTSPNFSPSDVRVIAVISVPPGNNAAPELLALDRQYTEIFLQELLQKGYPLVEKTQVETVLNEIDWQHSNGNSSGMAKIGKALNASHLLILDGALIGKNTRDRNVGTIYSGTANLSCRIVAVQSMEVSFSASANQSYTVYSQADSIESVMRVGRSLAARIPARK